MDWRGPAWDSGAGLGGRPRREGSSSHFSGTEIEEWNPHRRPWGNDHCETELPISAEKARGWAQHDRSPVSQGCTQLPPAGAEGPFRRPGTRARRRPRGSRLSRGDKPVRPTVQLL